MTADRDGWEARLNLAWLEGASETTRARGRNWGDALGLEAV